MQGESLKNDRLPETAVSEPKWAQVSPSERIESFRVWKWANCEQDKQFEHLKLPEWRSLAGRQRRISQSREESSQKNLRRLSICRCNMLIKTGADTVD